LFFRLRRSRSPGGSPGCSTTIVHSSGEHYVVAGIEDVYRLIFIGRPILRPKQATRSWRACPEARSRPPSTSPWKPGRRET